jgi:hypothetical protein
LTTTRRNFLNTAVTGVAGATTAFAAQNKPGNAAIPGSVSCRIGANTTIFSILDAVLFKP